MPARFRVGTSGWSYDHWREIFYPSRLPSRERLAFYVDHFDTVEVNASFYRLPSEETLRNWRRTVPRDFRFAMKASRYLTHVKRLADPEEPLKTFLDRARVLGSRLGPVLFQLPPRWKVNPERLGRLLRLLPARRRFVFEFRDPSWFNDEVRELLTRRGVAFCIYHMVGQRCPTWVTAPFVYLRFHGSSGASQVVPGAKTGRSQPSEWSGAHGGSYPPRSLARWAQCAREWIREGRDVYAYFNNDTGGHAARNARDLAIRVGGDAPDVETRRI